MMRIQLHLENLQDYLHAMTALLIKYLTGLKQKLHRELVSLPWHGYEEASSNWPTLIDGSRLTADSILSKFLAGQHLPPTCLLVGHLAEWSGLGPLLNIISQVSFLAGLLLNRLKF